MFAGDKRASEAMMNNFTTVGPVATLMETEESPEYLARRIFYHYLGHDLTITEDKADVLAQVRQMDAA